MQNRSMFTLLKSFWLYFQPAPVAKKPKVAPATEALPAETEQQTEETVQSDRKPAKRRQDPRQDLGDNCYQLAFHEARNSWELVPAQTMLNALEERGRSMAMAVYRALSEGKQLRMAAHLKSKQSKVAKYADGCSRANADLRNCKQQEAKLGPSEPCPKLASLLVYATTFGLTISIAPTLHDLFTGLDPFMKWLAGGVSGWGISYLIVHGMLPAIPETITEEENETNE